MHAGSGVRGGRRRGGEREREKKGEGEGSHGVQRSAVGASFQQALRRYRSRAMMRGLCVDGAYGRVGGLCIDERATMTGTGDRKFGGVVGLWALLFALLMVWGCPSVEAPEPAEGNNGANNSNNANNGSNNLPDGSCTTDSDCELGEVCDLRLGECATERSCGRDADCPGGEVCAANVCEAAPPPCTAASCGAGEFCDAATGRCEAVRGGLCDPCAEDAECGDGADRCVVLTGASSGSCGRACSKGCPVGFNCVGGQCAPLSGMCDGATRCALVECPEGEVCDPADQQCKAGCTGDGDCVEVPRSFCRGDGACVECFASTDCGEGCVVTRGWVVRGVRDLGGLWGWDL
jgi:hypothetical protein